MVGELGYYFFSLQGAVNYILDATPALYQACENECGGSGDAGRNFDQKSV